MRSSEGVDLGPYEVQQELGRGGAGVVYRALHRPTGQAVAVKVLARPSEALARTVRAEIAVAARLQHPHLVHIHDVGTVPDPAAAPLVAGTPWLAMSLAEGSLRGPLPWPVVEVLLHKLLDALGTLHGHGLVHRDVKPANILMHGGEPWLADFGLTAASEAGGLGATPEMAPPEQLTGGVLGPWTDLFALGRTARAVLDDGGTARVPAGFEGWLARMLAPDPADRFHSAAEARAALSTLDGPLIPVALEATAASDTFDLDDEIAPAVPAASVEPMPRREPTWPSRRPEEPPLRPLAEAGPGVAEVRRPPMIGREELRDGLWHLAGRALASARPQGVVVQGAEGIGSTRLVDWLAEASHQAVGALRVRLDGARTASEVDEAVVAALGPWPRWLGAPPQASTLEQLVACAQSVPIVLTLDAADAAVKWIADLLAPHRDVRGRILALLARETGEAPPPVLERMSSWPSVRVVTLEPLPEADALALASGVLGMAGLLAGRVVEAGQGHPGLIVAVVRDLVARRVLRYGASGVELAEDAPIALPATVLERWRRMLAAEPEAHREALRLAGLLGDPVSGFDWDALAGPSLLPLEARGWLRPTADGWRFADPKAARVAYEDALGTELVDRVLSHLTDPLRLARLLLDAERPREALAHAGAVVKDLTLKPERGWELVRACDLLGRALSEVEVGWEERFDLDLARAYALNRLGRYAEAIEIRERLAEAASARGDVDRHEKALVQLVDALRIVGRRDEATATARAILALPPRHRSHRVSVHRALLSLAMEEEDAEQVEALLKAGTLDPNDTLRLAARALVDPIDEVVAALASTLDAPQADRSLVVANLGMARILAGDLRGAVVACEAEAEGCRTRGYLYGEAVNRVVVARARAAVGMRPALRRLHDVQASLGSDLVEKGLVELALRHAALAGDPAEALLLVRRARPSDLRHAFEDAARVRLGQRPRHAPAPLPATPSPFAIEARALRSQVHLAAGLPDAEALATEALAHAAARGLTLAWLEAAETLSRCGRAPEGAERWHARVTLPDGVATPCSWWRIRRR